MRYCDLVLIVLMLLVPAVRADDSMAARALIDQAVLAQGGEAALSKWPAATAKLKGIFHGQRDKLVFFFTGEVATHGADRFRYFVDGEVAGRKFRLGYVFNGNRGWIQVDGRTRECTPEELYELQEDVYAGWVASLVPLKDPAFTLAPAGEVAVNARPALGVRVSSPGHRDVTLFFDKATGLVVKSQTRAKDDRGEEATYETFRSGYRLVQGTQQPMKLAVLRDGKPYLTWEVTDYRLAEALADGMFAKP
jgi:hypothetical protein